MPKEAIEEMCCDWCSVSEERATSPIEWVDKKNGVRWNFTLGQKEYIYNVLNKIWK